MNSLTRMLSRCSFRDLAKPLTVLLGLKTRSGYTDMPTSRDEFKWAGRAVEALVEAARLAYG